LAIERYAGGSIVTESQSIFKHYKNQIYDYNIGPRKACKPELLAGIINPFMKNLELNNTFFIAITRDSPPNPMKNVIEDQLPLLIDEKGNNIWENLASQIGFLSLEYLDLTVLNFGGYFRAGCEMHIGGWKEYPKPNNFIDAPVLRAKNWNEFPKDWVCSVDNLAECIKESVNQSITTIRYNGSYSFKLDDKTIGKLVLKNKSNPFLMVGFSVVVPKAKFYAEYLGNPEFWLMAPPKEPFIMVGMNRTDKLVNVCDVMSEFLLSFQNHSIS
jgi:hypothetical protein